MILTNLAAENIAIAVIKNAVDDLISKNEKIRYNAKAFLISKDADYYLDLIGSKMTGKELLVKIGKELNYEV